MIHFFFTFLPVWDGLGARPDAVSMTTGTSVGCGQSQERDVGTIRETEEEQVGSNGAEFKTSKGDKIEKLTGNDNEFNSVKDHSLKQ